MSGRVRSLKRRLARVEQTLANRKKEDDLVNCVCGENILAWSGRAKELEAELNRTCPAHGFRRVGRIHCFRFAVTETTPESEKERLGREDAELHQVIDEYKSRELAWKRQRSRRRQIGLEVKDVSAEASSALQGPGQERQALPCSRN
jgi:hypothetical protein